MPHVVTQPCCSDGSCVYACPVNCIHPSPDEPGFATTEMLYIDPNACVDCAACVTACPVGAIVADTRLTPAQLPFIAINAAHYPPPPTGERLPPNTKLAPVAPAPRVRRGRRPLTVAVVGSGPAGMYAADELLTQRGVRVNVFDKLPTPYGLVRTGVAPDHQSTKGVTRLFDRISRRRGFRFYLNVSVGQHLSHQDLLAHHHAVVYAVGAPAERRLDIDGMGLPGTGTATEIVAWINGHPRFASLDVGLDHERAVLIGNGNVALDVARLLTADPETLAETDISDAALKVLRDSAVREVVVAARRTPAWSAFTLPELIGLNATRTVVLDPGDRQLVERELETADDPLTRAKLEVLVGLPDAATSTSGRRIRLAYQLTPRRIIGRQRVSAIEFTRTGSVETVVMNAGLVLTSIGYRGIPVPGLPFDDERAVVPNDGGRVVGAPGAYVAGWIKRGPTGFIGTNKSCAMQTVARLVDDYNAGFLTDPTAAPPALDRLLAGHQVVDRDGWRAVDAAEQARGTAQGRPRVKYVDIDEILGVARTRSTGRRLRIPLLHG